jgi:hypothetical protein
MDRRLVTARLDIPVAPTRSEPLFPWRAVVAPWLVSRALAAVVIIASRSSPWDGVRFEGFFKWDGGFYLQIAGHGYGPEPVPGTLSNWPFFPLLPSLIRGIDEIGVPARAGIVALNQLLLLVALAGVWRLASRHAPSAAAALSVWALALFPASFLFSMVYPSALFLAASVWAFILVEDRVDLAATALAVVVAMTRPNGIVLAVALAVAVWSSPRRVALVVAPAFFAVGVWCLLCWHWTGDPFVFWTGKSAWVELDIVDVVRWEAKLSVIPHLALGLAALGVTLWKRRLLPPAWTVLTVLLLLPPLALGIVGMGRYAVECFPPFVAAGLVAAGWSPGWQRALFASGAAGMLLFGVAVVHFTLVP